MSTRCQIGIYDSKEKKLKDFKVLLYRHSDGYPEGVLPDIEPFLKWWKDQRGLDDSEYVGARLLQFMCNQNDGHGNGLEKIMGKNTDYTGIYGYGICKGFHSDIEYFYRIYPNKLEVYEVPFMMENFDITKSKLIKTIEL